MIAAAVIIMMIMRPARLVGDSDETVPTESVALRLISDHHDDSDSPRRILMTESCQMMTGDPDHRVTETITSPGGPWASQILTVTTTEGFKSHN